MSHDGLNLAVGRWYGWQMLPGYTRGYEPYFSPIRILRVQPLMTGHGMLRVGFWNALHAHGVQGFELQLEIRIHHAAYLMADLRYPNGHPADRSAVISTISVGWLERFCPGLVESTPAHGVHDAGIEAYLDRTFPC